MKGDMYEYIDTNWGCYPWYGSHADEKKMKEIAKQVLIEEGVIPKPENPNALSVITRDAAIELYDCWMEFDTLVEEDDKNFFQAFLEDFGRDLLRRDRKNGPYSQGFIKSAE